MPPTIISVIRSQFLDEAKSSPLLFTDLGRMESYISESYTGRSLIELLQNADDADATRFIVKSLAPCTYLIANDGREFTQDDMVALCRSGASTKVRGTGTIGFRGIGFKSVVNYAKQVHLRSDGIAATFSRELTSALVPGASKVPLIRIPHDYAGQRYDKEIDALKSNGYRTFFVFEAKDETLSDEAKTFDVGVLLFLRHLCHVEFDLACGTISHEIARAEESDEFDLAIIDHESSWLVTRPTMSDDGCSLAFSYKDGAIVDVPRRDAVFHSFMPTSNPTGIPVKVNGDFSTDPSRTKVVIDNATRNAASHCAIIACRLVEDVVAKRFDKYGVVRALAKMQPDSLRNIRGESAGDILLDCIEERLRSIVGRRIGEGSELVLEPEGFSDGDFDIVVQHLGVYGVSRRWERVAPGIHNLLVAAGFHDLTLDRCLSAMRDIELAEKTRVTIMVEVVRETRFGMSPTRRDSVRKARLISFSSGVKAIDAASVDDKVSPVFEGRVLENLATPSDYSSFAASAGLAKNQLAMNDERTDHVVTGAVAPTVTKTYAKARPRKWRSVEQNVAEVLREIEGIASVEDVTLSNVGYDLLVTLNDGGERYYEVKSVDVPGDTSFSFTTNEFSAASTYGSRYYLAIAWQTSDEIGICFVRDPAINIDWKRRATRWDWICTSYSGETVTVKIQ